MKETVHAIGYARISDPKQLQGDGLEIQEEAILRYIKHNSLTLCPKLQVEKDIFSGRKVHVSMRPKYVELRNYISSHPNKVKFFVIAKIDRSTRAGSEEYLFMKSDLASLGVELRDAQNVIQPSFNTLEHRDVGYEWSKKSVSRMTEILMAEGAREEVSNTLTRTVDTSISRVEKGLKLRQSNYSYKNEKVIDVTGKEVYIQVRDTKEAPHIEAIFEKTNEGVMTEQEIVDYINSLGFKSRIRKKRGSERRIIGTTGGIELEVKQMQKYRKNPIYCGVNIETWGKTKVKKIITKTDYKGLVSIEKFNQANKGKVYIEELPNNKVQVFYDLELEKIIKRRNKFRTEYVFKNVIMCDLCRKPLLASQSKSKSGKYVSYYHCHRAHKYFGIPQLELDKVMMTFLSRLKFADKYFSVFERVLTWRYRQEQEKSLDTQIILNQNIVSIQNKIKQTGDAYKTATNESMKKQFELDYETYEQELALAKIQRQKLEFNYDDLTAFLKYAKNLMEHPIEMFLNVNTYNEQMAIYKILFLEFPTYSEIVNGTPKISLFFKVNTVNMSDKELGVTPTSGFQNLYFTKRTYKQV